jgi:hypothetical protein
MSTPMIPKNLLYQNKINSAYARSFTTHIQPQNGQGDYTNGQTIMINIPTSQNQVLASSESVLKFDLTVQNGTTASYIRLDKCGAHGVIQRLRLYHGSQLLEDLDNYGNIVSQLTALQKSSGCNGKDSILQGFCNDKYADIWKALVDPATAESPTDGEMVLVGTSDKTNQVLPIIAGERLYDDGVGATEFTQIEASDGGGAGGFTKKRTYTINLLSIVGSLSEKYVPLFAMTSAPLRLELQLASNPDKFCCAHQVMRGFTVNNCEFIAQMMELGDSAMSVIAGSVGNAPLQWVVPQYRNFVHVMNIGTGAQQVSLPVPAKFNSLKSLYMTLRGKADGATTYFPHGSCRYSLSEYTLRLGSKVIPSKAPQNAPEFFCELLKSIGSLSDINHECMIDLDNYDVTGPSANVENTSHIHSTSSCPSFMVGVDLETYSNADKGAIFAGYNTSNEDVFFQLAFSGLGGATDVRGDTYALYDAVMVCEAGICSVRY